jgi:hypothetical protein
VNHILLRELARMGASVTALSVVLGLTAKTVSHLVRSYLETP